jgi:hypothetical protein
MSWSRLVIPDHNNFTTLVVILFIFIALVVFISQSWFWYRTVKKQLTLVRSVWDFARARSRENERVNESTQTRKPNESRD